MQTLPNSPSFALRSKAKKLEALAALLEDQEIAGELAGLLLTNAEAIEPTAVVTQRGNTRPRKTNKKRGALERKVLEVVKKRAAPVTAKMVTQIMEDERFSFAAENHQVAVSKALRQLAKKTKLNAQQNGHAKDPIIYTYPALRQVPVRETA
ncbi:MAG: hypothetical protein WB341_17485 [Terracidiphilus sp.]